MDGLVSLSARLARKPARFICGACPAVDVIFARSIVGSTLVDSFSYALLFCSFSIFAFFVAPSLSPSLPPSRAAATTILFSLSVVLFCLWVRLEQIMIHDLIARHFLHSFHIFFLRGM